MPLKPPNVTFGLNCPFTPPDAVRIVYFCPKLNVLPDAMPTLAPLLSVAMPLELTLLLEAPLIVIT